MLAHSGGDSCAGGKDCKESETVLEAVAADRALSRFRRTRDAKTPAPLHPRSRRSGDGCGGPSHSRESRSRIVARNLVRKAARRAPRRLIEGEIEWVVVDTERTPGSDTHKPKRDKPRTHVTSTVNGAP